MSKSNNSNTVIQAESYLLKFAAYGINMNLAPTEEDYDLIIDILLSKKVKVLFKWFWQHRDVQKLAEKFQHKRLEPYLYNYIKRLIDIISYRSNCLYWIERVNLFHVYGLCRLIDEKMGLKIYNDLTGIDKGTFQIDCLSDLSAYNIWLMLKHADATDSINAIKLITNSKVLEQYSLYQIFYYSGFSKLLDKLEEYKNMQKQVIIPQTIAGLFMSEPNNMLISKRSRERIFDSVLKGISPKVINYLEKIGKTHEIPF